MVDEARLAMLSRALEQGREVQELRRRALEVYRAAELPHRADHLWRFTSPKKLMPDSITPAARSS